MKRAGILPFLLLAGMAFGFAGCAAGMLPVGANRVIPDNLALQRMTPSAARAFLKGIDLSRHQISLVGDHELYRKYGGKYISANHRVKLIVLTENDLLLVSGIGSNPPIKLSRMGTLAYSDPFVEAENLHYVLESTKGILYIPDPQFALQVVDALYVIKETADEEALKEEARFDQALQSFRDATTPPQFTEDLRRLKVQAESAVREKRYPDAVNLYETALDKAPWWADGHFNRAMMLKELSLYEAAVVEMKRYLKVSPKASNARAAQDKIYEWEGKAK